MVTFADPVLLDASELFLELGRARSAPWRVRPRSADGSSRSAAQNLARASAGELPAGPWRSLGRTLDYSFWPDRERFLELDAAIALRGRADVEGVVNDCAVAA